MRDCPKPYVAKVMRMLLRRRYAVGAALGLLLVAGILSLALPRQGDETRRASTFDLVTSGLDGPPSAPSPDEEQKDAADVFQDPRIIRQRPLVDAADEIGKAIEEYEVQGYTGMSFDNDRDAVVLYWKGSLPSEISVLVEDLRADVRIDVIDSPYSFQELDQETRRIAYLNDAPLGINIVEVGPLPDFSGIQVVVERPEQLDQARESIQSPVHLEFSVGSAGVLFSG